MKTLTFALLLILLKIKSVSSSLIWIEPFYLLIQIQMDTRSDNLVNPLQNNKFCTTGNNITNALSFHNNISNLHS